MSFDFNSLVTDRTAGDVQRWEQLRNKGFLNMTAEERAEWLAGDMKGTYNKRDLNRVGECLNYLFERLKAVGYIKPAQGLTAKTNWTIASIPTAAELTNYLNYVSIIRGALTMLPTTPPTPADTGALTFEDANNIESILFDVEILINNLLAARYFSDEVFAGEI